MALAFKCDHCGRLVDGEPSGGVVHRSGLKNHCSAECFIALANSQDSCTIGDHEKIEAEKTARGMN